LTPNFIYDCVVNASPIVKTGVSSFKLVLKLKGTVFQPLVGKWWYIAIDMTADLKK